MAVDLPPPALAPDWAIVKYGDQCTASLRRGELELTIAPGPIPKVQLTFQYKKTASLRAGQKRFLNISFDKEELPGIEYSVDLPLLAENDATLNLSAAYREDFLPRFARSATIRFSYKGRPVKTISYTGGTVVADTLRKCVIKPVNDDPFRD